MQWLWPRIQLITSAVDILTSYHWLREHTYENGTVELEHFKTEDMHADVMTKALASEITTNMLSISVEMGMFENEFSGVLALT